MPELSDCAIVCDGGAAFRVWAPFARRVAVVGDFNAWDPNAHPLAPEGSGYWSLDVAGVKYGHEYQYAIVGAGGDELLRIDPYARDVTSSAGNAVVADLGFDWEDEDFQMPPWHQLVI